jgi:hypothetical protein
MRHLPLTIEGEVSSVKPVLVYEGELYAPHREEIEGYFYRLVRFDQLLEDDS